MSGCVDVYGYAASTGSWLLCGWAPPLSGQAISGEHPVTLVFENGSITGNGVIAQVLREDLGDLGFGVLVHLQGSRRLPGRLISATVGASGTDPDRGVAMHTTAELTHVDDETLLDILKEQRLVPGDPEGDRIHCVLRRPFFTGHDTLDRFEGQFAFQIDEAIRFNGSGMLLNGWLVEGAPVVRQVRLRSGQRSTPMPLEGAVRTDRADVIAKYGAALRSSTVSCGFITALDDCLEPGEAAYVELEVASGEVGFLPLRFSPLRGLAAIRSTVANLVPRYDEVRRTFDILGPALSWLNRERLARPPAFREIRFGTPPDHPDATVIVPLYGRIDYMEVQVALLAQGGFGARHEVIYVVDDPSGAAAASRLADSLYRRFRLPLRLLLGGENVGFAPACNAGLRAARGHHVCFLNSDVFGTEPDWLDRLIATLRHRPERGPERGPGIGIVGPLLLFEDGTIQHAGMRHERLPEFGDWFFPVHPGKGRRPVPGRGVVAHPAITGACMVMSRHLALELDGFDERYVIGDFEDSDLCLRARRRGVGVAVDHGVSLFHLERKSQASGAEAWRLNVTLLNAWLHQAAWAVDLEREPAAVLAEDALQPDRDDVPCGS